MQIIYFEYRGIKIIMKKLDYETCNLVLDYISENFGYSDDDSRSVLEGLHNRLSALQSRQQASNIFDFLFTNKKIKDYKNAVSEMSNDIVQCVYSEYALDYIQENKQPLTLKEVVKKAQEKQRLAEEQERGNL